MFLSVTPTFGWQQMALFTEEQLLSPLAKSTKKNSWYLCFQACRLPLLEQIPLLTIFVRTVVYSFVDFQMERVPGLKCLCLFEPDHWEIPFQVPRGQSSPPLFLLTAGLRRSQLVTELLLVVAVGHQSSLLWPGWAWLTLLQNNSKPSTDVQSLEDKILSKRSLFNISKVRWYEI